jgi:hypothetical protein
VTRLREIYFESGGSMENISASHRCELLFVAFLRRTNTVGVVLVDTHAFKEAFVQGRAVGYVIADQSRPKTDFGTRPGFAEIYDVRQSYTIFEDRAMAEARLDFSVARDAALARLAIQEVNVDSIRAYQQLAGRKTVFLVDREGRTTQSLRVGDMPLAARTNTPFPGPLPPGARLVRTSSPMPRPAKPPATAPSPPSAEPATPAVPAASISPRKKPTLQGFVTADPFSHEPANDGSDSSDPRTLPRAASIGSSGWLSNVMRRLLG